MPRLVWTLPDGESTARWATDEGGGSQPGASIVRGPFVFSFDDVGLNDGIEFYTPTVGDVILDVFSVVDTAFDGTTPKADFGISSGFVQNYGGSSNWFGLSSASVALMGAGLLTPADYTDANQLSSYFGGYGLPLLVTAANPLKVWASQDGLKGGAAVGGTQGAARLYIFTATPVPFA